MAKRKTTNIKEKDKDRMIPIFWVSGVEMRGSQLGKCQ